jgi:hypothetical protein
MRTEAALRGPIDHGISAQIASFTGTNIVDASVRYMSTTCWYHLGEIVRVMNN